MGGFKVGIVAFDLLPQDIEEYMELVTKLVTDMVEKGVQLVLLPGLTGFLWASLLKPTVGGHNFATMLQEMTFNFCENFYYFHCTLAGDLRVFLCPGTIPQRRGDEVFLESCLINNEGQIIGFQYQTHLIWEKGISKGDALNLFESPFGKIGILAGSDMYFPATSRILGTMGAEIILAPTAHIAVKSERMKLAGLWRETQQNHFFGLEACFHGEIGNLKFYGPGGIYSPCEATIDRTGIIAQGHKGLVEYLDMAALKKAQNQFPVHKQLNWAAYEDLFQHNSKGSGSNV